MTPIQAPTHCPSCNSKLVWVNHLLYCRNTVCESQAQKKLEHFAKTLKIKGLGPSSIQKLELSDIDQIYTLSKEQIAECLSSEKLAEKLYAEILNSISAPLNLVLPAFSIPLIGKTATDKLSKVCKDITDINAETCEKAGLGPKATESLLEWLSSEFYSFYDGMLPFTFKFESVEPVSVKGIVCISGKLKSFKTKAEATQALNSLGYEVKSSLTKQVTILVNESGIESLKTKQARESGVIIVTNLKSFLEN
jgi:NAD-dependent DNA ligase